MLRSGLKKAASPNAKLDALLFPVLPPMQNRVTHYVSDGKDTY